MNRRVAGLSEFRFVKLDQVQDSLEVVVAINGWLDNEAEYTQVWRPLQTTAPLSECYVLRWETEHLLAFGAALKSLTMTALAKGWVIGKIKGLLIGSLLAAVAWPMWLVKASDLIDNSWSIIMDRSEKAAMELANVLEMRGHGHRPVSLIGYGPVSHSTQHSTTRNLCLSHALSSSHSALPCLPLPGDAEWV
jgi:hypothetical protein